MIKYTKDRYASIARTNQSPNEPLFFSWLYCRRYVYLHIHQCIPLKHLTFRIRVKTIENRNETLMINNITNLNNTTPDIVKCQSTKHKQDKERNLWTFVLDWQHIRNCGGVKTGNVTVRIPSWLLEIHWYNQIYIINKITLHKAVC